MNLQVLVSTMHQKDHSLLDKMNIQSDAIVINQCDRNEIEEFEYKGHTIKFLSFAERGIGLSRNNALMRSTAEICLFADDDIIYEDGYRERIINAFYNNPKADIIVFNALNNDWERPRYLINKAKRVRYYNCLRYGAVRIAARVDSLKRANVYFSLLFGGGAKYSSGEDSLFLADCIRKGLYVYALPEIICTITQSDSTWFSGYTDQYFINKGVFFACLSKRWAKLLCLQLAIRRRNMFKEDKTVMEAYRLMLEGISERTYS